MPGGERSEASKLAPMPAPLSLSVCGLGSWDKERVGAACMGVYTSAGGGEVFTCGSTDWAHGLVGREEGEAPAAMVTFSTML